MYDHDEPDTTPAPRRLPAWVTDPTNWILIGAAIVVLALIPGAVWLIWWLVTTTADALTTAGTTAANTGVDAGRWLVDWPVTRTLTDPIHTYLIAHAAGLPASANTLWWTWLSATGLLFLAAWAGSPGARIGWVLLGAGTTAMVWAGTPADGRFLAAGLAIATWAVLSIPAFSGLGLGRGHDRDVIVIRHRPEPAESANAADS